MKIFENGLLENNYINSNYRGLIGWEIDYEYDLVAVRNRRAMYVNANDDLHNTVTDTVKIKEFTSKKIPIGELCWVKATEDLLPFSSDWKLVVFEGLNEVYADNGAFIHRIAMSDGCGYDLFVPYLIAETEHEAEELKNWNQPL